ncbi:thiol reductant ABC exporter subunit CydD [Mycolicibacterium madagascariense]|uniref:Thiol reductant ABC exporter subunit CydD n=1 Tax=Mycolicibacterium madagascariense TaxID=212765 RepID=A0A7I7XH49_9MYCO|nr:thiol reductant ABC exporter subunit CydD [Mycolicibacterium madagascariense]MCV7012262.1 thiol reductant ABC exporter subunit CydD [Mycolicibacterium madagascariense]BBZ28425.1 thiol reductant ABC exporter subunit CydD [Mycolicibacterium madagascariense]
MRRHLVASAGCGVVITGTAIAGAVVVAHLVAGIVTDPRARTVEHWSTALGVLAVLWTVRALAQWQQARLSQGEATAAIADLDHRLLTTVTALAPHDVDALRDETAVVVTRGLDGLRPYYTRYLPAAVQAAVLTPAALVTMACYDLQAAVIVVLALPLVPVFMVLIGLLTADRSAAALTAMTTLQSRLLDLISGLPTLRGLGRAAGPERRVAELAAAHRRSTMATLRITFLSSLVLELLATLGVALVAVSVGLRLVSGHVDLAAALTALLLAPEVFWPLRRVGAEFHAAQDGRTARAAAEALLANSAARVGGTARAVGPCVDLEDVTVSGRDGDAPHRLTARVEAGSVTVLTGPNGSGKSTAIHVILGLITPTSGRVTVGGVDAGNVDLRQWWDSIGWLPQRPALVAGTVRANLELFGALPDLGTACRRAGFDEVLATLPDGLDTVVGRDGAGLSLGQRQRLALARTLGSGRPILLLDEPTAHLDAALEARVLHSIREIAGEGAAVLVVGHRAAVRAIGDHVVAVGGELPVPH